MSLVRATLILLLLPLAASARDLGVITLDDGTRIHVSYVEGTPGAELTDKVVLEWVHEAASGVARWYGGFPVRDVRVRFKWQTSARFGFGFGFAERHPHARVTLKVGAAVRASDLRTDWVLVHELLHLGVPAVPDESHWFSEGVATYAEGFVRAQMGWITADERWRELLQRLPDGQPKAGDLGLDRTKTWARTYWGGALFCFVWDVQLRRATGNQYGLADAMRAVIDQWGSIRTPHDMAKVTRVADKALGVTVGEALYQSWSRSPIRADLTGLWSSLGLSLKGSRVVRDVSAPSHATCQRMLPE
jgi:hypothetical protein